MTIKHTICRTWDDFVGTVRNQPPQVKVGTTWLTPKVLFRGQAETSWPLHSKLERHLHFHKISMGRLDDAEQNYRDQLKKITSAFKIAALTVAPELRNEGDAHLWKLGRHHGLLTHLLDWSASPYIAAHFAFEKWYSFYQYNDISYTAELLDSDTAHLMDRSPVRVWALSVVEEHLAIPDEFELHFDYPLDGHRQIAQKGAFTQLWKPHPRGLEGYLESRGLADCLHVIDIEYGAFLQGARDMQLMNINPLSLFPDLEGAARFANISYEWINEQHALLPEYVVRSGT